MMQRFVSFWRTLLTPCFLLHPELQCHPQDPAIRSKIFCIVKPLLVQIVECRPLCTGVLNSSSLLLGVSQVVQEFLYAGSILKAQSYLVPTIEAPINRLMSLPFNSQSPAWHTWEWDVATSRRTIGIFCRSPLLWTSASKTVLCSLVDSGASFQAPWTHEVVLKV